MKKLLIYKLYIIVTFLLLNICYANDSYGGKKGNEIFQTLSKKAVSTIQTYLKQNKDFDFIFNYCIAMRKLIAKSTNSKNNEKFAQKRLNEKETSFTPVAGFEIAHKNIANFLSNLLKQKPQETWQDIDSNSQIRLRIKTPFEWLQEQENILVTAYINNLKKINTSQFNKNKTRFPSPDDDIHNKYWIDTFFVEKVLEYFKYAKAGGHAKDIKIGLLESRQKEPLLNKVSIVFFIDTNSPFDPLKLYFTFIHPKANQAESYKNFYAQLFVKALKKAPTNEVINNIGKFWYHFDMAMPFYRGSAAIGEWLCHALFEFHNLSQPKTVAFSHVDQLIQSSFSENDFLKEFHKLFSTS